MFGKQAVPLLHSLSPVATSLAEIRCGIYYVYYWYRFITLFFNHRYFYYFKTHGFQMNRTLCSMKRGRRDSTYLLMDRSEKLSLRRLSRAPSTRLHTGTWFPEYSTSKRVSYSLVTISLYQCSCVSQPQFSSNHRLGIKCYAPLLYF